jgi:adenylate cyclase
MARFLITDPSGANQVFEITGTTVNIGRVETNDLHLPHPSVSRHHARVTVLPGDTTLINDLGSLNGVYVNGQLVREHSLNDQDRVMIGMYELRYEVGRSETVHLEPGTQEAGEIGDLTSRESLTSALRVQVKPGAIPESIQDRVRKLERENKLLKLLLGVGKTLSSVLTPDEIMHRVMELVFQMENVERGFVMLRDERRGFRPAVILYKDEKLKREARSLALSKTVIDRVTTERLPLLIHDVAADERFSASESLRMSGIRSAMCAPLIYKDRVFGLFYVDCLTKPYAFSKEELSIFSVVAAEAAISFDSAKAHEDLAQRMVERKALERYLSSAIVERVLANPDQIHLGGENQIATVMFTDIRSFTPMSENMEPHQVVELLNEYFTAMTDLIFENGGTLDKYLGDGIMAIFGAPLARPDDADRAVKTAMEMQRALVRLNEAWVGRGQRPIQVGMGINTGQVTAGNIGSTKRMDYTVIGDTVNTASRLCSNAAGGQILVSDSTYAALVRPMPATKLSPIKVKGKEAPVEVFDIYWGD